jgi:hypothetical protein
MRPLNRTFCCLFFLCSLTHSGIAGDGVVRPVCSFTFQLNQIRKLDSVLEYRVSEKSVTEQFMHSAEGNSAIGVKICSCQILNLESTNYNHRYVVLLAEKTNDGHSSAFTIAKNRIRKEKKHLKNLFYDKVRVVAELQGAGSCKSMFYKLRLTDRNLQLYEILNAD